MNQINFLVSGIGIVGLISSLCLLVKRKSIIISVGCLLLTLLFMGGTYVLTDWYSSNLAGGVGGHVRFSESAKETADSPVPPHSPPKEFRILFTLSAEQDETATEETEEEEIRVCPLSPPLKSVSGGLHFVAMDIAIMAER